MRGIALRSVLALLVFWTMAQAGHAQTFYTCMSAQGRTEFSEQPCSGRPAEKVESLNCRKARQDLDSARFADPRRSNLQARRAAMESACGLKPPMSPSSASRRRLGLIPGLVKTATGGVLALPPD